MSAFRVLGFSTAAVDSVWALVAAILHLGNMDFMSDENEECAVRDSQLMDKVAALLEVHTNDMANAVLTRVISAGGEVSISQRAGNE